MFHLLAYHESVGSVSDESLNAVQDDIITIQNNRFLPQRDYDVPFLVALSTNLTRMRLVSPSNRQITLPIIRPQNDTVLPSNLPKVQDFRDDMFRIRGLEALGVEVTTDAVGPSDAKAFLGISDGVITPARGNIFVFRGTSTTAAVAHAWTTISTAFVDTLPAGAYQVVGLEVQSTNALAARIIFEEQILRPGGISITSLNNQTHRMFYAGGLGVWGVFDSTALPQIQVFAGAADVAHEVLMSIIRIR